MPRSGMSVAQYFGCDSVKPKLDYCERSPNSTGFLVVEYGDNDYGWMIANALSRLYSWIQESNSHLMPDKSIRPCFESLLDSGSLATMLDRLISLECLASQVESATRGLYRDNSVDKFQLAEFTENTYLNATIRIKDVFDEEWTNGEVAWLNFDTGQILLV